MTREPIHVSMAINQGYELPLTVALTSLAAAHLPGECAVSILHSGLASRVRRRIEGGAGDRLAIEWIPVDERILVGAHAPAFLTTASLYRLLLPRLLEGRDRTIYLDADLVVLESLEDLWHVDLGGHTLAAVRDAAAPWAAGPAGTNWRDIGIPPDSPYFNSGVLLLPLDLWRREHLAETALELLRRVKTPWGDQCAINSVAEGRWLELPRRWNLQTADVDGRGLAWALWRESVEEALANPAIIHFNERAKPWSPGAPHPLAEIWFHFHDRSGHTGWWSPAEGALRERSGWAPRATSSAHPVGEL
jgi:lipopolysaccharide biosynthesis glycosyltransferase